MAGRAHSRLDVAARAVLLAECYFRDTASTLYPGCDVDRESDLLSAHQQHRPSGVSRLLEVTSDETAFRFRLSDGVMAGQLRHLLDLADSPRATVRLIPPAPRKSGSRAGRRGR